MKDPNLSTTAMFIAAALRFPQPRCNGRGKWVSTINVDQYKVKFTDVRIYCTLAHPELVKDHWQELQKEGEPDEAFKVQCLLDDARHYRNCYLSMLELLPADAAHLVCQAADYFELLCKDLRELDQLLTTSAEKTDGGKYPQYLTQYTHRYGGETFADVRQYLAKICCFKLE